MGSGCWTGRGAAAAALTIDLRYRLDPHAGLELLTLRVFEETHAEAIGESHGHSLIGREDLVRADEATGLPIDALEESVRMQPRTRSTCFVPRHRLRAHLFGGDLLDLGICFQCNDMRIFLTNPELPVEATHGLQMPAGPHGAQVFDRVAESLALRVQETLAERLERTGGR